MFYFWLVLFLKSCRYDVKKKKSLECVFWLWWILIDTCDLLFWMIFASLCGWVVVSLPCIHQIMQVEFCSGMEFLKFYFCWFAGILLIFIMLYYFTDSFHLALSCFIPQFYCIHLVVPFLVVISLLLLLNTSRKCKWVNSHAIIIYFL